MIFSNFSHILSLFLLMSYAIQGTHARVGTPPGIEEMEAGRRFTFPALTGQLVHGICVTGASSAQAHSSSTDLTYTEVRPFVDGALAWDDRSYVYTGIIYSPCAGGIFLRPTNVRANEGTVIDVSTIPNGSSDTKVCAIIGKTDPRDGGWSSSLVEMGFVEFDSDGFKWDLEEQRVFCKVLTKQKRCDELYVLEGFNLQTDTDPIDNPPLGSNVIASYDYAGSYPIESGVYSISSINYDSICWFVKQFGAPKCDVEVEITFCKAFNCESTTMSGKILASGTGPKPYVISGGTDDLFVAEGTIDSELDVTDLALKNVKMNLCFNDRA